MVALNNLEMIFKQGYRLKSPIRSIQIVKAGLLTKGATYRTTRKQRVMINSDITLQKLMPFLIKVVPKILKMPK